MTQAVALAQQASTGVSQGFKNRIINGAMVIDQRNAGASVTPVDGSYTIDRWQFGLSQTSKLTTQQSSTAPAGFTNSLLITSSSAYSVVSTDEFEVWQKIEGYNMADLNWGSANAKTVTLSFWVRSSLTGTFGGIIRNNAGDRVYPFTYSISAANTWEQKSVTITGDTTGTWLTTTSNGMFVWFSLGAGSSKLATAGAWTTSGAGAIGQTSVVGTNGATFYITGVQLEVGSTATSFDYRPYGTELQLCQRYYQSIAYTANSILAIGLCTSTTNQECTIILLQTMRSNPTITLPSAGQTSGTISFLTSSGSYPASTGTNTVNNPSVNNFVISGGSYSASFVQGNATWLYPNGNVTIRASAEL